MKRRSKLWALFMVMALLGTTLFSGFIAEAQEVPDPGEVWESFGIEPLEEPCTLSIGYFSGALYSAIMYSADQKGWFENANITLDYQSFESGPSMMEANANWDIGCTGAPGALNGLKGYDVNCIGIVDYEACQSLIVRSDSAIAQAGAGNVEGYPDIVGTPETWKGTTWVLPVGTSNYMLFLDTLNKLGLTIDDVTATNMDVSSAKAAFVGGQGDGVGCWNTIALGLIDDGYVEVANANTAGVTIASAMIVTDDALQNKFDQVVKFYEVFLKAQDYFAEHQDEYAAYMFDTCQEEGVSVTEDSAAKFIKTYSFLPSEYVIQNTLSKKEDIKGAGEISGDQADLMVMLDFFIDQGSYTEEDRTFLLTSDVFDTSVAEAVAEDLGISY